MTNEHKTVEELATVFSGYRKTTFDFFDFLNWSKSDKEDLNGQVRQYLELLKRHGYRTKRNVIVVHESGLVESRTLESRCEQE